MKKTAKQLFEVSYESGGKKFTKRLLAPNAEKAIAEISKHKGCTNIVALTVSDEGLMITRCGYCLLGDEGLKKVQLRHRTEWQQPIWCCEPCRDYLKGYFRYILDS